MKKTMNIASMGFSGLYPENTMLSYEQALAVGVDCLEVDAHLTKDGVVVLSQDDSIDRATDAIGKIRDYTYEELSEFNAAFHFEKGTAFQAGGFNPERFEHMYFQPKREAGANNDCGFQKIPKLESLLRLMRSNEACLIIDLRSRVDAEAGIGERICELIKQFGLEKRCTLSSMNHPYIKKLSSKEPAIRFGVMFMGQLHNAGKYVKALGASVLQNCFIGTDDIANTVQSCLEYGVELYVWSPVKTDVIAYNEYLLRQGVDGIITHYPDRLAPLVADSTGLTITAFQQETGE